MPQHENEPFYTKHIFICTNLVEDTRCCGQRHSETLFVQMRALIKKQGITGIAVTKTGCMGRCMSGPAMVIYPDNVWYAPRNLADIEAIISEHLIAGRKVQGLLMPATEPVLMGYDIPSNALTSNN